MSGRASARPPCYLAVIGDLISSRQLAERESVQQALKSFLERCNQRFRSHLQSPFRITLGDEFQGLVRAGFPLEQFVFQLHSALRPRVSARLGLGLGGLSTRSGPVVSDLDGPCFHSARDAVNQARQEQRLLAVHSASGQEDTLWLGRLLALPEAQLRRLSLVRWQTGALLLELGHPAAVARARAVTRQSVDDTLAGGLLPELIDSLRGFAGAVDGILSGGSAFNSGIQADPPANPVPGPKDSPESSARSSR